MRSRLHRPSLPKAVPGALLCLLLLPPALPGAELVRIGGTGGAIGTMRKVAAAYMDLRPEVKVQVLPSIGSSGAVRGAADGIIDIGLTSRDLTDDERQALVARKYATTPFVFAAGDSWRGEGVTSADLLRIYSVGGQSARRWDRPRPVLRPPSDSDTGIIRSLSPAICASLDVLRATPGMLVALTDQEAADLIATVHNGFGVTTLALIVSEGRRLKALSLDGVAPTLENLDAGRYRLSKTFYAVTRPEPEKGALLFLDFLLSPRGGKILRDCGNLPSSSGGGP